MRIEQPLLLGRPGLGCRRPGQALRPWPLLPTLAASLCRAGCSALQPVSSPGPQPGVHLQPDRGAGTAGPAAVAIQHGPAPEPRYLRFKADDTGLSGVQDDGRYTYLEFSSSVGAELELFDQDGRPLESATAGRVVAVRGFHPGILVHRRGLASFVSQNPRAVAMPRPPLSDTAEHAEVRARLDNHDSQLQAMQRALEAARLAVASAGGRGPATRGSLPTLPGDAARPPLPQPAVPQMPQVPQGPPARLSASQGPSPYGSSPHGSSPHGPSPHGPSSAPPKVQEAMGRPSEPGLPEVVYASSPTSATPRPPAPWPADATAPRRGFAPPLAAANASASAPERGLLRVFFATASRAIVAPEDGLALLLREAGNADEIRVTGFTDATGSRAANDVLAQARADAVVQLLLRRGIPAGRIFSSAVGADEYLADNASERGRALNRRVEVLLLRNRTPMLLGGPSRALR
jgi:hypothetical protein